MNFFVAEEINVTDEPQAENQRTGAIKKLNFGRPFCLLRLAAAQKIAHAAHSCKGGLCVNASSRVAWLAAAPPSM